MAILTANNQSLTEITALPSVVTAGSLVLLETQTASGDSAITFDSDIDDTYKEYIFKFYDIHPATDNVEFSFQGNAAGGSGYNETVTSTMFYAYNQEDDGGAGLGYSTSGDQAQGTAFIKLGMSIGNDNDQSCSGYLHLFDPSSTTFVKHFFTRTQYAHPSDYTEEDYKAGYINTTSAIDEIQFKMSSGNIDAGTIKMYGVL